MPNITDFSPIIQATILSLSGKFSLQEIADQEGVSKQAIHKRVKQGTRYLEAFEKREKPLSKALFDSANQRIEDLQRHVERLKTLISKLRRELILTSLQKEFLHSFKTTVLKFFPRFKAPPLQAEQKLKILEALSKFRKAGGVLKDFADGIGRCVETLSRWEALYKKHGLSGLTPKKKRPKNFGNQIPSFVKNELLLLFSKFPRWTPYQYHSYIRHNPIFQWYVSIPTIKKLKQMHLQKSEEEKERIKKRWCFERGSKVWTVDFTSILKTEHFHLQLLTVSDHRSRFLFPTALFLNTSTEIVVRYLEDLFIKFGKPDIIKVDNGPEFRLDCREKLLSFLVYLLSSPQYYGQFNGAHERIHRTLKKYIDDFDTHQNLTRLVEEIRNFENDYDYSMTFDYLRGRTPASVYFYDPEFIPQDTEIVTPYEKDAELRMKFISRDNAPVRLSMPLIMSVLNKFKPPPTTNK